MFLFNKYKWPGIIRPLASALLAVLVALQFSGCARERDARMWNAIDYATITRRDNDAEYVPPSNNCLEEDIPDASCY
jgi:hypothetical protein